MRSRSKRAAMVAAAAVALAAVVWMLVSRRAASFERRADRNLLLVTIDTLRADALGSYGGAARTPNLDRLAAGGVRFDFAHAHAVLTRPSHASIFTGTYPYEHGVRDHSGYRMKPDAITIATLLKDGGFATGAFVGGVPVQRSFGLDRGFDVYDDNFSRAGDGTDFSLAERPAAAVVASALQWIGRQRGRWFVWVHVFDPHGPYTPPPPFDREYADRPYLGEVAYVDQSLGPLFDAVARGERPTFTIVTSDHGEGLGDHGELTHGLFAYESTLHVPLILADLSARARAPSTVSHFPARHIDILPTLLDAAALPVPSSLHGRSLLRLSDLPPDRDVSSYFEAMSAMLNRGWAPLQGVVAGREKYVDLPKPELYDLARDPQEQQNLVDRELDRRRVLEARLRDFHAAPPGERVSETPDVAAALQSLGYTSGSAPRKAKYTEEDDPKALVDLDKWIQQGIDAWEQGRHDEALQIYRRLIARRPSMPLSYRNLALLQWQTGDARGAIDTLERAFHVGATEPDMVTQLGSYLAEAGRPDEAIALLKPVTSTAPNADALNALGIAYAREGHADAASAAFERAARENPKGAQAYENLGALEMQRGNIPAAEHALRQAIAIDPRSARAHNGLGVIALRAGRRDEAFAEWTRAVELAPHDYEVLYNLGVELDAAGRRDQARPYLERFVREAPPSQYGPDIARVRRMLAR